MGVRIPLSYCTSGHLHSLDFVAKPLHLLQLFGHISFDVYHHWIELDYISFCPYYMF